MIGIQPQSLLKIRNRLGRASFPRGQKTEVVPGVRQSIRIAGAKFGRAFEALPRFIGLLLFQIDASQAVQGLRARRISRRASRNDVSA